MPMPVNRKYISVKCSDAQLRERNRPLSILLDMSGFLSSSMELKPILDGALAKVLEFFGLKAGRIYLMDESGELLSLAAHRGVDVEGLEEVRITEGFSGMAARTRSFIAQHVSELEDEKRSEFLASKGFKVVICVPLLTAGMVVGVMNLAAERIIEMDQGEIDLLIAIGNQIAIAVNNARLYAELHRKMKELKAQKEATEFLAYSISHDLKSPAVGIFGLTKRLQERHRDGLGDAGREYCRLILKASEQIVKLVERINTYITAKEAPLYFEKIEMKEILTAIHAELAEVFIKRNVTWSETGALPTFVADRMSMTRLLRNLVDNALKYGGEGLSRIEVQFEENGENHYICVYDDGVALKEEEAEKLFELFHRHVTSRAIEGTGLGLAIVKEIAERHNGGVWLEPGQGKGTTFRVAISKRLKPAN